MKTTADVNQWVSQQCGTKQLLDIQDPRCREIVREHFKICTDFSIDDWFSGRAGTTEQYAGKTIAEAEIACIRGIYNGC